MFEKSRLYMIIILRFETIQRKSVFRRVIYSTKYAFFFYSELFSFSPYNSKKLSWSIAERISNSLKKIVLSAELSADSTIPILFTYIIRLNVQKITEYSQGSVCLMCKYAFCKDFTELNTFLIEAVYIPQESLEHDLVLEVSKQCSERCRC